MAGIDIGMMKRSWTILSAAIVIAAGAWGYYAWRHMRADMEDPVVASGGSPPGVEATAQSTSPTPLRATRPSAPTSEQPSAMPVDEKSIEERADAAEPTAGVLANQPPSNAQPVEITLSQPPKPASPAADSLGSARQALQRGELIRARAEFAAALRMELTDEEEAEARNELLRIAQTLIFSRAIGTGDPLVEVHTVAAGDTLYSIGRQYMVTEELLAKINQLADPHRLRVGQTLKVVRGPFSAIISKSHHRMDVYLDDILARSYRVGLGVNGGTPTGTWAVNTKLINPDWTDPTTNQHYLAEDPDNPIGERWLGLEGLAGEAVGRTGFGIHGTIDPESIGQNMSLGCIRLKPDDVAEVYELLVDRHSRVTVVP